MVSVVVLTFNSEDYIRRALVSLRKQTVPDIEVIVVDAGSTDRTKEIVQNCGLAVTWLELPGSDMGMARNYGVRNSKGRYLMFLDSDDFYLENKVALQVRALEARGDLDAIFSAAYIYKTGQPARLGIKTSTMSVLALADFLSGSCYTLSTICLRRSVWDRGLSFNEGERGRYGEDWRFQVNLAWRGFKYDFLDLPTVVVEMRSNSHTSWAIQPKMKELALATAEEVLNAMEREKRCYLDKQAVLGGFRFKLAISLLLAGRTVDAERALGGTHSIKNALYVRLLACLSLILPMAWFRNALRQIWLMRQSHSFTWVRPSVDISRQLSELTE